MSYQAKDIQSIQREKFILYGATGSGKTTLVRTLPGRKFMYVFDPCAVMSIEPGDDITFNMYLPEIIPMSIVSLRKAGDRLIGDAGKVKYSPAETYLQFEEDFERRLSTGFFTDPEVEIDGVKGGFDCLIIDSSTTLLDLIMDRILQIQNRPGKFPEQDDWTIQMDAFRRIVRNATATGLFVCFTAHEELVQGKLDRAIANQIMFTGKLKQKLPLLFSDIYRLKVDRDRDGKIHYYMDTVPDSIAPLARCSLGLPPTVDVTLPPGVVDPTQYGLGKILRERGKCK